LQIYIARCIANLSESRLRLQRENRRRSSPRISNHVLLCSRPQRRGVSRNCITSCTPPEHGLIRRIPALFSWCQSP
jgi:hypothetical protein